MQEGRGMILTDEIRRKLQESLVVVDVDCGVTTLSYTAEIMKEREQATARNRVMNWISEVRRILPWPDTNFV